MRSLRLVLPLLALVAAVAWTAGPHPDITRAQSTFNRRTACCSGTAVGLRELDFPYYSLRDGFESQLNLVSDSPKPIDLTIAIYSQRGSNVLASMTIQPNAKLPIDLRRLLTGLGADLNGDFGEGSIAVHFEGTIMPVVGQVTLTNPALRLVHESEMMENDPGRTDIPPVLNSLWWNLAPGRDARIMVANMSARAITADVSLDYQGQRHASTPLIFNAHELKVLSVLELLGQQNASAAEAPEGGITILQRGGVPSLIAQGKILDSVTGFSTTLHFPSPELERASALHASGVPIGKPTKHSPFAGMGYFTPHVVVRNLLATPQKVTLTVEYPNAPGWDSTEKRVPAPTAREGVSPANAAAYDPSGGAFTGQLPLGPFTLAGYSTADVSLDSFLRQLPERVPYGSMRIQYNGAPGSVVAEVSSVEHSKDLVVDAKLQNEGNGWAGSGANPWHLDSETESLVCLTDMSDKPARIGFNVWAEGTTYYLTKLRLAPHETRVIDLRKLRDAQRPDFKGNKIPAGATDGSVLWLRIDNMPVMGRVVAVRRHGGVASSYDCCTCPCPPVYTSMDVQPANDCLPPGDQCQMTAQETTQNCNLDQFHFNMSEQCSWGSTNSPVAAVNAKGLVTAVKAGSATITATLSFQVCDSFTQVGKVCECDDEVQPMASTDMNVADVSISGPDTVPLRTGGSTGPNSMMLTATGTSDGGTYQWTTDSGDVTLTDTTSPTVTVTAASASGAIGDVSITVTYTPSDGCPNPPTATYNITVEQPSSLQVESDSTNPTGHTCVGGAGTSTCGQSYFSGNGTYGSYLRNRTYHVMDQFSPSRWIQGYALQIQESYTPPTGQCAGPPVNIGNGSGDTVTDCFYFCSATCESRGTCNVSATQTITINGFTVATKSVNWTCAGVTVSP